MTQPDLRDRRGLDGKEGVIGSSPMEGSRETGEWPTRRDARVAAARAPRSPLPGQGVAPSFAFPRLGPGTIVPSGEDHDRW